MNTLINFLDADNKANEHKSSINYSAMRRGFHMSSKNETHLHLVEELGEVIQAFSSSRYDRWYEGKKECGFFSELADLIILSISGEYLNHWWYTPSPFPIPNDTHEMLLLLSKTIGTLNRVNSVPYVIIEWCKEHEYSNELMTSFVSKLTYNETRG